ncbi:monooxygenase [Cryptosporangium aurantiacum]|uniref:Copper type II ascorbate-dependent monooxygenase, C-terminal domain n=1 Tax=Cryptosporangium aurantiacum TaxID=134849 RepID=A0A1M7RM69_9ACTN|nr:monooxygenase [Cryptosporangium aurantiacum]SHN47270.1 Copper type II ascorbate-dependent monooxygenase, C-terminal domain [Cryptosporangium aurantiacum]
MTPARRRLARIVAALLLAASSSVLVACSEPTPEAAPPAATHLHATTSPPPTAPLRTGERFQQLAMAEPYTPQPTGGGTDEYRCFLVDPKLTAPAYLTGSQFLPQNPAIVHHAIFFRVPPEQVAEAQSLDAEAPGAGWRCFGGTGIGGTGPGAQLAGGAAWVAAWAPGGGENLTTPGTGYPLAAGSRLVMQVHYSLLATGGEPAGTDRSGIRLRLVDRTTALTALKTRLLTAPVELACAPGESGNLCDRERAVLDVIHRFGPDAGATVAGLNALCNDGRAPVPAVTQRCDRTVRDPGTIHAVAGHMHLLGKSIRVELNPGKPGARTLLDVPRYDFDDQGARPLTPPVAVKAGDTLRVTCTHDATLRRTLPALKSLEPRYVVWGDGTSDEMCLGVVIWAPEA